MKGRLFACVLSAALAASCAKPGPADSGARDATGGGRAVLAVTSTDLAEGKPVPAANACTDYEHLGRSPALAWSGVPDGTKSIAITAVDPDAKGFVHWALIGLPPTTTGLPAGASPGGLPKEAEGAVELPNGFGKPGYGGPCPPPGALHHYVFEVYALRQAPRATAADPAFLRALDEDALATGTLTATFRR